MTRLNLYWILGLTLLMEGLTCFSRFGLGLQSTRDTAALKRYTFGLRIHHGYFGVVLVLVAVLVFSEGSTRNWLLRIGGALFLSDLIHHFLVLWPITGDHQFDLKYPE